MPTHARKENNLLHFIKLFIISVFLVEKKPWFYPCLFLCHLLARAQRVTPEGSGQSWLRLLAEQVAISLAISLENLSCRTRFISISHTLAASQRRSRWIWHPRISLSCSTGVEDRRGCGDQDCPMLPQLYYLYCMYIYIHTHF